MSFIAGRYTATLGASALGQTADGFRVTHSLFKRPITGDALAQTVQDRIIQGAELFVSARLIEYNAAGAQNAFWPLSSTIYDMGVIGRLDSAIADSLVLTAVASTPAAAAPASATFLLTTLAEGFPVELLFAPDLREIPLRLAVLPNASGVFGTQT
ncbi:MAG: hypothetical protein ACREUY_04465 [Burkholderiales bacterium]